MPNPRLTFEQARRLLAPVGEIEVAEITVAATTNDVFQVVTRRHGRFYVKLHTARWYADQPDTFFVVNRECAVHALLHKRGMPLPYPVWADYTRTVVDRSAFICGELPGTPVPDAIAQFPHEREAILAALARYIRRLHAIEFSAPGLLEPAHARFSGAEGIIPPVPAWEGGHLHHAAHVERESLALVRSAATQGHLGGEAAAALEALLRRMTAILDPDYHPPRLTVGNCHAWHFHVQQGRDGWTVLGFYDLEAVSAGDPTIDLVELEVTLVPCLRSVTWRGPFLVAYGRRPGLEGYKMRLIYYLLHELGKAHSSMVPDPDWLERQWVRLVEARDWEELAWFPVNGDP